jgi:hypothetical protein
MFYILLIYIYIYSIYFTTCFNHIRTSSDNTLFSRNLLSFMFLDFDSMYRVIQEELPPLTELISEDILSKNCHINLGHILNIYRVRFVIGNALL